MTKKRRWLIPLGLILAAALLLGAFWDSARVYLFPKAALTGALTNTAQALESRFAGSPLQVLLKGLDGSLSNTVSLEMTRQEALLGDVNYNMTLQTQLSPRRISGTGTVTTGDRVLDLGLYLDADFAAVTSEGLLAGGYYGITYDTFPQDIRKSPMLAFLIGEDTLTQWENDMASLQETMGRTLELPEFSAGDLKMAMVGLLALRPEVTKETAALAQGTRECFRLRFQVSGELIRKGAEMADMRLPVALEAEDVLTADFYLAENYVVRCDVSLSGTDAMVFSLWADTQPVTDTLHLELTRNEGKDRTALTLDTVSSEVLYTEEVTIRNDTDVSAIRYSWNRETGEGQLSRTNDSGKTSAALKLTAAEDGFRIQTNDLDALLAILGEGEDKADTPATLTVTRGSGFDTPVYKNLDQWSMEDILILLEGLGGLLGLNR